MGQGADPDVAAIDAAMQAWRQGDCVVGSYLFVHRFNPDRPNSPEAEEARQEGVDLVEVETAGLVVVSQTCDIRRSCGDRPVVNVCPLVLVAEERLEEIRRMRRPRYAFLPGVADRRLAADLDRVMTVEKGLLATWKNIRGCRTDREVRDFADAISRKFSRYPFPDDFTDLARELQNHLIKKHGKQSPEGNALQALREIRIQASPSWDAPEVKIHILFIREDGDLAYEGVRWEDYLEKWLSLIPHRGRYSEVTGTVCALEDLTARDYVDSDPLDLDHLSGPS